MASGRAPILMRTGIPSLSLPTSISSTVPLNISVPMSAIVISGVPAWYEVSGTTGSPGLTWRLSTVPEAGARITESTPPLARWIFPSLVRASRSRASSSWILAWSNACWLAS